MSDQDTLMQEIEAVVGEVQELLRKSGVTVHLHKDDEEMTPATDDMSAAPEVPMEAHADVPADAIDEQADEAGQMEEASLEDEAQQDEGDLAAEAQSLSDEDLDKLLEVLMAEKEGRTSGEMPQEPMEAPAQMAPAEKSMKEEYSKLGKSLEILAGSIESLNKKVDNLAVQKQPVQSKVTVKAPSANTQEVQVLHKSTPIQKRLNKSETVDFLENQLRKGNKLVDRDAMWNVSNAKSEGELHAAQDGLTKKGIEFPKL